MISLQCTANQRINTETPTTGPKKRQVRTISIPSEHVSQNQNYNNTPGPAFDPVHTFTPTLLRSAPALRSFADTLALRLE